MFQRYAMFVLAAAAGTIFLSGMFLPWWGTVLVILGMLALGILMLPMLIRREFSGMMEQMFDARSRVLREAKVTVHAVELTEAPPPEAFDEFDDEDRPDPESFKFILVDATIEPSDQCGPMHHWEPSEMRLVDFQSDTSLDAMHGAADAEELEGGDVAHAELVNRDGTTDEDFEKVAGTHRLRMIFACPKAMTGRAKFQYYFEGLGDLKIPA